MCAAVADRLEGWACKEFNFTSCESEVAFESLCRGKMADVWSFVVSHVKPLPVALHIRHQLKLHSQANSNEVEPDYGETKKDVWRRNMLLGEEAKSAAANQETVDRLMQLEEDIKRDSRAEYCVKTNTGLMKNRILYYSTVDQDLERFIAYLNKESKMSNAAQYFSRETLDGKPVLSTQCMKLASDQSKAIYDVFMEMTNKFSSSNDTFVPIGLDVQRKRFQDFIGAHSAREIMNCLSKLIDERLESLEAKLSSRDFEKDLENLQFQSDPIEGFVDTDQIQTGDKKAKSLMAKRKLLVIEKLMESDKSRKRRLSISKENSSILESILKEPNGSTARELIELEVELNSCKAELDFLIEICEGLEKDLEKNFVFKNYIKSTLAEVKSFNAEKVRKELVIRRLMLGNILSHRKLSARLASMDSLKRQGISSSLARLKLISRPCIGVNEVESFMALADKSMNVAKLNNKLVLSSTLSIYKNFPKNDIDEDNDSRALIDKTVEDIIFDFKESKLRKAEADLLHVQQKEATDITFSAVDIRNLLMNLKLNYQQKLKVTQSAFASAAENHNDWETTDKELKKSIELWWDKPRIHLKDN